MDIQHKHTERGGHFYLGPEEAPTADLVYRMAGIHKMIIDHTEVSQVHREEGIGQQLVAAAVTYARVNGMKILPLCSFAKSVIAKIPEYQDIL